MGKRTILVNLFCLCAIISFSQNCIPTAIVFSSQAQVDAFPSNYPGCTIIDGNVGITDSVQNLDSLIQITKIKGSLSIIHNYYLNDIEGLNNLTEIGGTFTLLDNSQITQLNALTSLNKVGGNMLLNGITSVIGLTNLDSIIGDFISTCENLDGLISLNYIGSDLRLSGVSNFGPLINIDSVNGNFEINASLANNFSFPQLKYVNGNMIIQLSSNIIQLSGFNNLDSINGNLKIAALNNCTTINGFNNLKSVNGEIDISQNQNLDSVNGFENLKAIRNKNYYLNNFNYFFAGNLLIQDNSKLIQVSGFDSLKFIESTLQLVSNPFLSSINGFDHEMFINNIYFENCPFLSNCNVESLCKLSLTHPTIFNLNNNGIGCTTIQQIQASCPPLPDIDNDGIPDISDNCINTPNPNQEDSDNDDIGNACDPDYDQDGDGITNQNDNCDLIANPGQEDANIDGEGNVCDTNSDSDNDGVMDANDNCVTTSNSGQEDSTNNGIGDACEDTDNDGIMDDADNCIYSSNPNQEDGDNDDIGDACEPSATCGSGNIILTNQDQVDDFKIIYPGCTEVLGSLIISGTVENLDSLNNIFQIDGSLLFINLLNQMNYNGLNNLLYVGNDINITGYDNAATVINGFNSVERIEGNLKIYPTIFEFNSFNTLTYIGGDLILNSFYAIGSNYFNSLDTIINDLTIHKNSNNPSLNLSSMSSINFIGGNINLNEINNFGSLNNLDTVFGDLYISRCNINSNAFNNLKKVNSNFGIINCLNSSLNGFNQLNSVNSLSISDNQVLTSITGFQNFSHCVNDIILSSNQLLNNIDGLNHEISVDRIQVSTNSILSICDILPICEKVNKIPNNVTIYNNSTGCNSIQEVQQSCPPVPDTDGDGKNDLIDNCINIPNTNQADANNDGEGNVCDSDSDTDNDGSVDSLDNCVTTSNPNQADANNDGEGDKCDNNSDSDSDGKNDNIDNCPSIFNPDQRDCNNNNIGDVCEAYIDNDCDGIANSGDNCPETFNPYQIDYNNNSIGDACENFPKIGFNTTQPKTEMHLSYSNLYLDHPEKGIIYKASNNQCYKSSIVIINNQPQIQYINIPCP